MKKIVLLLLLLSFSSVANATPKQVSAGFQHTCAITGAGALYCWGDNTYGQLGDGTFTNNHSPVLVSGMSSGVTKVAAGGYFTCAVMNGDDYCWGANNRGQIGNTCANSCASVNTPQLVAGFARGYMTDIAVGWDHACTIGTGSVWCWGDNSYGELGGNEGVSAYTSAYPALNYPSALATHLAAGVYATCAVYLVGAPKVPNDGYYLYCWGWLPNSTYITQIASSPTSIVDSEPSHGILADVSDSVIDVQMRGYGGNGTTPYNDTCVTTSPKTGSNAGVTWHSSSLGFCWNNDSYKQLGDGTTTNKTAPVKWIGSVVNAPATPTAMTPQMAPGGGFVLADNTTAAATYAVGYNQYGQLGNSAVGFNAASIVTLGSYLHDISAGFGLGSTPATHTCGLGGNYVYCWGGNYNGELGLGTYAVTYGSPTAITSVAW